MISLWNLHKMCLDKFQIQASLCLQTLFSRKTCTLNFTWRGQIYNTLIQTDFGQRPVSDGQVYQCFNRITPQTLWFTIADSSSHRITDFLISSAQISIQPAANLFEVFGILIGWFLLCSKSPHQRERYRLPSKVHNRSAAAPTDNAIQLVR